MNGHGIRLAFEKYGKTALAHHLGVKESMIEHLTENDPISKVDLKFGNITFDIKYASPTLTSRQKKQGLWDFDLRKKGQDKYCDFYLLIGIQNGIPRQVFLVAFDKAPTRHIRISVQGISKYQEYRIF